MDPIFAAAAAFCLIALAIRSGYEALKQAGGIDTTDRLIFAAVFAAMFAMLASWPLMCPRDPWRVAVPAAAGWLGTAGVAAALVLAVGALLQLRALENVDHLVTTGLFARLRHPMYTGFILWIGGWVLRSGALASLAVACVAVANILWWRRLEERALEAHYGDVYRSYRARTWC